MGFVLMKVTFCFVLFFYTIKLDYPPTKLPLNFPEYDPKTFRKTAANVQLMPNIETLQLALNRACLVAYYLFLTDKVKTLVFEARIIIYILPSFLHQFILKTP